MHVLIVEPLYLGHRLNIAGLLLEGILRLPSVRVTFATTPEAAQSEQFGMWIKNRLAGGGAVLDTSLPSRPSEQITYRYLFQLLAAAEQIVVQSGVDHAIVPAGDGITNVATLRQFLAPRAYRQAEWETMLFRGRSAYLPIKGLREKVLGRGLNEAIRRSPMDVIHHMDPIIAEDTLRRQPKLKARLTVIPDPVDPIEADLTQAEARRRLNIPESGRVIGTAGMLDSRKGVDLLIRAFVTVYRAGKLRADDRLLLVGKLNPELKPLLKGASDLLASGNIITVDRFVSDVEMSNGLSAMDVVATPYPAHIGSASIAIRGAAQRRPVLASTFGWLGVVVPKFGLGSVCEVTNAPVFEAALVRSLEESADYQPGEAARQFVRYSAVANFQSHWVQRLAARMKIPQPAVIRWDELARVV